MTRAEHVRQQTEHLLDRLLRVFDKAILAIPPGQLDFRPTPDNMSAKAMAHHVYQIVLMTAAGVEKGEVRREDAGMFPLDLHQVERPEELVEFGARVREYARGVFSQLDEEGLDREVRYFFGMTATGYDSIRNAVEEVLHHRGQMHVYLRLMGVKPPSVRDFG